MITTINKILIIRYGSFGDVFITTSGFESIKKKYPNVSIYYLIKEPFQEVVLNHPYIDSIITFKKEKGFKYLYNRLKLIFLIKRLKFDVVIDYQNNSGTRLIAYLSNAKHRIGNNYGSLNYLNNYRFPEPQDRYSGSLKFDMLQPLGIVEEKWIFYFYIDKNSEDFIDSWLKENDLDNKKFAIISPGSIVKSKIWRLSNYAELGDMIQNELGLKVILLYAPNEIEYSNEVYNLMKQKPILAPKISIMKAVTLIKKASVLICNDSAINHLSCATNTKTVAIFGNTDKLLAYKKLNPNKWSPHSVFNHHHLLYKNEIPSKDDNFGIHPNDVIKKLYEIL